MPTRKLILKDRQVCYLCGGKLELLSKEYLVEEDVSGYSYILKCLKCNADVAYFKEDWREHGEED